MMVNNEGFVFLVLYYLKHTMNGLNVANGATVAFNPYWANKKKKPKQHWAFFILILYPLNKPMRCVSMLSHFTPWIVAHQAPLSLGFSKQE